MEISIGLSPIEAGQPLSPATRHRLGEPLPHQQADRDKASPQAPEGFAPHKVEIMQGYPPFRVAILHLRASSLLLLSRLPLLLRAARLACVRHTANVNPEPGSNSPCKCMSLISSYTNQFFFSQKKLSHVVLIN